MSKFNNASRTLNPTYRPVIRPDLLPERRPLAPPPTGTAAIREVPGGPGGTSAAERDDPSMIVRVGFFFLCALLLSGYLNDWSYRLVGGKAYLSTVCIVLLPLIWLISGQALKGFHDKIGMGWLILVSLMAMGLPFSEWRTGTLDLLQSYIFRSLSYFFFIVAFTSTLKRCRTLMTINIFCTVVILFTCVTFGSAGNDEITRFHIADSMFLENSNELALQLLLGVTFFLFLFFLGGFTRGVASLVGIAGCLIYMLKTGSRGCLISAILLMAVIFIFSERKPQLLMFALPILAIAVATTPSSALRRYALIFLPEETESLTYSDSATIGSTIEREKLMKAALTYSITRPIFGVGAGQFAVAYTGEGTKKGEHRPWLGTHNSYLQISAECGLPALAAYLAVIFLTLRRAYGIYRQARGQKKWRDIEGLGFCLFCAVLVYAVGTFFFHLAYSSLLPLLTGQVVALSNVARPIFAKAVSERNLETAVV